MQEYLMIGGIVLVSLIIYGAIWKRSPKLAMWLLFIGTVGAIAAFGDFEELRRTIMISPDGNLGEIRR